ncbi:MAG TPA: L-fucose:H+ symporter permease [Sphingomicrobium sp.]|jgi:FHS family L-fucose permease-like MFS transporter
MTENRVVRSAILPLVLIVSLFFLWGLANNLNDVLIKQFQKAFTLTYFQAGLVQMAFYLGYFLLAVPAALLMRRYGYKAAVVIGLVFYGIGALLFYPAAQIATYGMFLLALFVIACGLAFLETAANPLVTVLGDTKRSEQRLNFAQSFNPLGSIIGLQIGQHFILSGVEHSDSTLAGMTAAEKSAFYAHETQAVVGPYVAIGLFVLAWAALVALTRFPEVATRRAADDPGQLGWVEALGGLRHKPKLLLAVVAQFFYVGAQVGVWSFTIRYAQEAIHIGEKAANLWTTAALAVFLIGRFVGSALMSRFNPARLMALFATISIVLGLVAAFTPGLLGLIALTAISFFMSIMFPTIFALGVKNLGPYTQTGASLIVMAIIGGALMPPFMGWVADQTRSMHLAMLVPAACFVVIALYAMANSRNAAEADSQADPVLVH